MKRNYLTLLLVTIFVFMLVLPAQAATVSTLYLDDVLTCDEYLNQDFPTTGCTTPHYRRAYKLPATADITVAEEPGNSSNYCFKIAGGSTATNAILFSVFTSIAENGTGYSGAFASAGIKSAEASIKLPQSATGETHLFAFGGQWELAVNSNTAGVILKNGGAYYYDQANNEYVNFIADNTLAANTWYKVVATYDVRTTNKIMMLATVSKADGTLVGESGWQFVSTYSSPSTSYRMQTRYKGYAEGENVLIDDIAFRILTVTPVECATQTISDDYTSASFTFTEVLDPTTVTKDNIIFEAVNPNIEITEDDYTIDYTSGTLTVNFGELPYDEDYKITITKNVRASGDVFGAEDDTVIEFSTPEDPLKASLASAAFSAVGGGEIVAGSNVQVSITLDNTSARDREYMLIVTSWNADNECVAIRNLHGVIEAGDDAELTLPAVAFEDSESVIRLSLVKNWSDLTPIGAAVIYAQ